MSRYRRVTLSRPSIARQEIRLVSQVLKSGSLAQSRLVQKFESEFSNLVEGHSCIAVNSGTSALHTIFMSLGIGQGDEIIVPNFSFAATANSAAITGATVMFADVDSKTFCIDVEDLKRKITNKTKAIVVVHLYGCPANMNDILELASRYKLYVVEDAAQAHLAGINGKPVGTFGIAAAFSFYATKNMTSGEGGMIVTSSKDVESYSRMFRNQGMLKKYENEIIGLNYRMTEVCAAVGLEQLNKLENFTYRRIENASILSDGLKGMVEVPDVPSGFRHVFHQYTIKASTNRDLLQRFLAERGIETGIFYPHTLGSLKPYRNGYVARSFPNSERLTSEVLSLPVQPALRKQDLAHIISSVQAFFN